MREEPAHSYLNGRPTRGSVPSRATRGFYMSTRERKRAARKVARRRAGSDHKGGGQALPPRDERRETIVFREVSARMLKDGIRRLAKLAGWSEGYAMHKLADALGQEVADIRERVRDGFTQHPAFNRYVKAIEKLEAPLVAKAFRKLEEE